MVPLLQQILFYSKVVGTVGGAITALYTIFRYLRSSYSQRKSINDTVALLATNHFPHLQASLDSHGEALRNLTSDVRIVGEKVEGMERRLDDTKTGVRVLSESFLRHLENSSRREV